MKRLFFINLSVIFTYISGYGQHNLRICNSFIIVVDGQVATSIVQPKLILSEKGKEKEIIEMEYVPGDLSFLNKEDMNKIYIDSTNSLNLKFYVYEYRKNKQSIKTFNIQIARQWLRYSFILVRFFKNGKYALDFPGYSILPLQKG